MDQSQYVKTITVPQFSLWEKAKNARTLLSLSLEITPRCNNNCVHCYINKPENDSHSICNELSFKQLTDTIDAATELGALWILLSGGEPLLREDFSDIYIYAKKKGMLVSVFTNASLISKKHVSLFKAFPPRALEISIYGISEPVHKRVTRASLLKNTMTGIHLLKQSSVPVTLKAIAMKSNYNEMNKIYDFCKNNSDRPVRIDSFLNLRYDKNPDRNRQIQSERLNPEEIVEIDKIDKKRWNALRKKCAIAGNTQTTSDDNYKMLRCGAGVNSCCVSYDGIFKLCTSLSNNEFTYDLKNGSLKDAWEIFTPKIRDIRISSSEYVSNCGSCDMFNVCTYCAANADLEGKRIDAHIPYFCDIAKKRVLRLKSSD